MEKIHENVPVYVLHVKFKQKHDASMQIFHLVPTPHYIIMVEGLLCCDLFLKCLRLCTCIISLANGLNLLLVEDSIL